MTELPNVLCVDLRNGAPVITTHDGTLIAPTDDVTLVDRLTEKQWLARAQPLSPEGRVDG